MPCTFPGTAYMIDDAVDAKPYNLVGLATITLTNFTTGDEAKLYSKRVSDVLLGTAKTGLVIDIDFGSAKSVDTIALLGLNISSTGSIRIRGDSNPAFPSPTIDVTVNDPGVQHIEVEDTPVSLQYWRINMDDASNEFFPWIGELMIGERFAFNRPHSWGHAEVFEFRNVAHETDYGTRWVYHHTDSRSLRSFTFSQRTDAEAEELEDMITAAKGSFLPLLVIPDVVDDPDRAVYGFIVDQIGREFRFLDWNNFADIPVIEQPRALVIRKS